LEIHFLPLQGFGHDGLDLQWSLQSFSPSRLPHVCALPSGFALSGFGPLIFPSLCLTPLGHLMLDHLGLGRIWAASEGFYHALGWAAFGDTAPFGAPSGDDPIMYSKNSLILGSLPEPFHSVLALMGPGP
jgi:hypothetical protein